MTRLAKYVLVRVIMILEELRNQIIYLITKILWPYKLQSKSTIKKILVYRVGNIGDLVVSIPCIIFLKQKFPKAKMVLLSSPGNRGSVGAKKVFQNLKIFDEVHEYYQDDNESLFRFISNRTSFKDIDLVVDLPSQFETLNSSLKRIFFHKYLNPKYAFGWEISTSKRFRKIQNKLRKFPYEKERLLGIIKRNTAQIKINKDHELINLRLSDWKFSKMLPKNYIVIAPGSKRPTNQWGEDNLFELLSHIHQREINCVLIGGDDVKPLSERILKIYPKVFDLCGSLEISESMQVIQSSKLSICLDSGVQHISNLVNVPTISIFSSRDFSGKWFPSNPNDVILRSDIECDVCLLETCPYQNKCINMITPGEVIEVLDSKLNFGEL